MSPRPVPSIDEIPQEYAGTLEPTAYCRAWNPKRKKYCAQRAGAGTSHKQVGRCRRHDGGGDSKLKHGLDRRYQFVNQTRLKELIERLEEDENPLDTRPELSLLRALTHDYIERYADTTQALLAWHRSWGPKAYPLAPDMAEALRRCLDDYDARLAEDEDASDERKDDLQLARDAVDFLWATPVDKPHQVPDIADAGNLLDKITKAVERIENARSKNAFSAETMKRFFLALDRTLASRIKDPDLLAQLTGDILAIPIV